MDVEGTLTLMLVACSSGKVDRKVPRPVREGIRIVVERRIEAGPLEPGDGASHIPDLENRLEPGDITQDPARRSRTSLSRCPLSPARQLWQIGRSGCDS